MDRIEMVHDLPSGPMPIEFLMAECPSSAVPLDLLATRDACKTCGAFGRNWGCPPFAPRFERIAQDKMLIVCARIAVDSYPRTVLQAHFGVKMLFSETFLKPLTDRFGRDLAKSEGGILLSSGNCRVCRKCAKKDGVPCRKPKERTHSLEATGVLVTQLMKKQFGFSLQWWSRERSPEYMCKVIAVTF